MKRDIDSRADIESLLTTFYDKLLLDKITAPIFKDLDMEEHIPIITDFWAMVLLGDMTYKGSPFDKHVPLSLKKIHFDRWLYHFNETIDNLHSGEVARMAKERAKSIAIIFQNKLSI